MSSSDSSTFSKASSAVTIVATSKSPISHFWFHSSIAKIFAKYEFTKTAFLFFLFAAGIIAGGAAIIVVAVLIIKCIQQRKPHSIAAEEQSPREQTFHEPSCKEAGGRRDNSAIGSDSSPPSQNPWSTSAVEPLASTGIIITRERSWCVFFLFSSN